MHRTLVGDAAVIGEIKVLIRAARRARTGSGAGAAFAILPRRTAQAIGSAALGRARVLLPPVAREIVVGLEPRARLAAAGIDAATPVAIVTDGTRYCALPERTRVAEAAVACEIRVWSVVDAGLTGPGAGAAALRPVLPRRTTQILC